MKQLYFDERWIGPHGIGRFAKELAQGLNPLFLKLPGRPTQAFDAWRLRRSLQALPQDSLFLNPGYTAPLGKVRLPYVLTVHDLNHIDLPDNSNPAKRLYYRAVLQPGCHHAATVLTVSEFSRQRIVEWSGIDAARIINVGNGVDPSFSPVGEKWRHTRPYILSVSNRRTHKNEFRMLKAFAASRASKEYDLLLTGQPTQALQELAQSVGILDRLVFTGTVQEGGLPALYRGAQLLFFPSLYEGFGLPLIEAMACATPCLTSNTTALPEVGADAVLYANPLDISEMAQQLDRLLSDDGLRNSFSAKGPVRAAMFGWESVVEKTRRCLGEFGIQ